MPDLILIPNVLAPNTQHTYLAPLVKDAVKQADTFFVEDLRTARRFISSLKLGVVIEDLTFEVLNKDTDYGKVKQLFAKHAGKDIGIISEAGCPCVADPGSLASLVAHELKYKIIPLPGPSSILMALMASGFNGQQFSFHGYLSIDKAQKIKELRNLDRLAQTGTQVFMETPYRNNAMMEDILTNCSGNTHLCVAVDITAESEFIKTLEINSWKKMGTLPDLHKRPTIFLLKSNPKQLSSNSK